MNILKAAACLLVLAGPAWSETLRIGMVTPPSHQWTLSARQLAETLADETDGRLALTVFPSGQLGNEAQMLQQLQAGALDFAFLTVGELANRDPDFGILVAPYLVPDAETAARLLQGRTAAALQDKLGGLGLRGLGMGMAGMRIVLVSDPVADGETLAGRKIRTVPLAQELDFWTKAGAAPTPLPLPDLFDAYANGQIDGMQIDLEGTWNNRFHDHSAQILDTRHMIFPMFAVASARKWQGYGDDDRALIARLMAATTADIRAAYQRIDDAYRARLAQAGAPLRRVGPEVFGDAVDAWYRDWRIRTPLLVDLERERTILLDEK